MQQCLYFLPLPQGQVSFLPIFIAIRCFVHFFLRCEIITEYCATLIAIHQKKACFLITGFCFNNIIDGAMAWLIFCHHFFCHRLFCR